MPLFKPNGSDQSIRSADRSLPEHVISAKNSMTTQNYIAYIETELTDTLLALHEASRFVSALDVAKAEKSKIIKRK